MNVYDFDKTIYDGDCTVDFYFFCLRKNPSLIRFLPKQCAGLLKYCFGFYTKTQAKVEVYSFLRGISNVSLLIKQFWALYNRKIMPWYLQQKRETDIIISASPVFLLETICGKLGVCKLIASDVDCCTGDCVGENCYGEEKVMRFRKEFPLEPVECFYSDSLSDTPMAQISKESFIVSQGKLTSWQDYNTRSTKRFLKLFLSKTFLCFLIVGCINTINGILFALLFSLVIVNANLSFIFGYMLSLTISYLLNSHWVFHQSLTLSTYCKFCISYIPNFFIQNIFVFLVYNLIHAPKLIAFIISAIIGIPVTFVALKLFAFSRKDKIR